jgi:hypothetical protein
MKWLYPHHGGRGPDRVASLYTAVAFTESEVDRDPVATLEAVHESLAVL